ncbi:MAG: acyltransferase family protein [Pirellulales bacterium]
MTAEPRVAESPIPPTQRLVSLDAYRGLIMLMMASAGFGLGAVAKHFPDCQVWQWAKFQTGHCEWVGCSVWDLIQPAFMFMVGVAVPYSYSRRQQEGQSSLRLLGHAGWRAFVLVLLAIFLISPWSRQTVFSFSTVLAQIGLGYVFVVLLRGRGVAVQSAVAVAILVGYWALFALWPLPPAPFDRAAVGVPADWFNEYGLSGFFAHWNKNTNFAAWFDTWFLNLFPRERKFEFEPGGYQTLNFVPSMATMIFGLMAGELLRSDRSARRKLIILALAGVGLMVAAQISGWTVCPVIKRIWSPSWALLSGAYVVWLLAAFYAVFDVAGLRRLAFPLAIVGMNSLAVYVLVCMLRTWTWKMIDIHLGWVARSERAGAVLRLAFGPDGFNTIYMPIVESLSVVFVFWLVCLWMYRRKIFVRI